MSRLTYLAVLAAVAISTLPGAAFAQKGKPVTKSENSSLPKPTKTGHVEANGVNYYYAIYGKGEPLLLLHGFTGSAATWAPHITRLAPHRRTIAVDLIEQIDSSVIMKKD